MARMRLRWTDVALSDLREIEGWVRSDRPAAARRLARRIRSGVERLRIWPLSGRVVPGFEDRGFREVIVPPYRIVYLVARREVQILRVWDGRRDIDSVLE